MLSALAVVALTATTACTDASTWREEVLLHDGNKIIIKRSQSYGGLHEISQAPPIKEHTITFTLPNTNKTIKWKSEYSEDVGRANFDLLALHVMDGVPYIIATPNLCLSYNKWGRPNPPYVLFKYVGKEWERIPLAELPPEFKTVNVDYGMPWDVRSQIADFGKGDLLTAETIQKHNENNKPEFKSILRGPLKDTGYGRCAEMIYTNDGWESLGFFRSKRSLDACLKYCDRREVSRKDCPCEKLFNKEK